MSPLRLVTLAIVLLSTVAAGRDIYVSPTGDDAAAGTAAAPLKSLQVAVDRAAGDESRVLLLAGRFLNVSLTLGPAHSGLTIEAALSATPILVGGVPLTHWTKLPDGRYAADLPPAARDVRMIRVGGRLAPRARFPETGTLAHRTEFKVPWMSSTGGGWKRKPTVEELTTLSYTPGDLPKDLDLASAEVTVYHMWDESTVGLAAHDPAAGMLKLAPPTGHPPGAFGVRKFVLWNLPQGLTGPGQWYHDRAANRIVYWPMPGEDPSQLDVLVPTTPTILRIAGKPDEPAKNITIRGLSFSVTSAPLKSGGFAADGFDGAIELRHADAVTLDGVTVSHVAGHGIAARNASNVAVRNSHVHTTGAGGIYVGGARATIDNNHVHHVGLNYPSAIGIFRGGTDCAVTHNHVHHTPYSAINYGGTRNLIANNLIDHCMETLHDGAAIYLFAAKDCTIRGNVARDIANTGGYGASAYYLDERSEGCVVERNVSVNVPWPTHNHMAKSNAIRHNVFVHDGPMSIRFQKCEGFTFEGNVCYATGPIRVDGPEAVIAAKGNVLFSAAGKIQAVPFTDYSARKPIPLPWPDVTTADPQFVDLKALDLRYRNDSPAKGLTPLDIGQAGLRK